ncbi:MAG: adenylate/guanylate cyclase domain-containing protein [Hyphomicrobiales bacterium]
MAAGTQLETENLQGSEPGIAEFMLSARVWEQAVPIRDWLVNEAALVEDAGAAFDGFCERLLDAGVPLDRAALSVEVLHSENSGIGWFWNPGDASEQRIFPYGAVTAEMYEASPLHHVHQSGEWLNLWLADTPDNMFGIVPDLKADGFAQYLCVPMPFRSTNANAVTFATCNAEGFSEFDIALLRAIMPALRVTAEVIALNNRIATVLKTYVGREPQKLILGGDIHRGEIMRIRSAILFVDMRGFTSHSMAMKADEVAEFLNRYYDCIVPGVEANGGEVLKFIGDGVLAIFRTGEDTEAQACRNALAAARDILDAVNRERQRGPGPRFDVKVALHIGDAAYGNVGSGQRLDFTVIGKGVNIASRLTDLCGELQRRLLVSSDFRDRLRDELEFVPAGIWELRGIARKQDVYEPPV